VSSLAKDNKIKYLEEEMVVKEGFDAGNSKAMEEIIRKKNADIAFLKKQFNFPATEDPTQRS